MSYTRSSQKESKIMYSYRAQDTLELARQLDSIQGIEIIWCKPGERSRKGRALEDLDEIVLATLQAASKNITFYGQGKDVSFDFSRRECGARAEFGFSGLYGGDEQATNLLFERYTRHLSLKAVIGAGIAVGASLTAIIAAMVIMSGQ